MLGKLNSKKSFWRRNPRTGKLTVSRLYLVTFDGLSKPLLTDKTLKIGAATRENTADLLIECKNKLKPLPKGIIV